MVAYYPFFVGSLVLRVDLNIFLPCIAQCRMALLSIKGCEYIT